MCAGKIILFPIVSEYMYGGGNAAAAVGSQRITTHFLIQVVDAEPKRCLIYIVRLI